MPDLFASPAQPVQSVPAVAANAALDERDLKRRFALELLRTPNEPFNAARRVFPADTATAIFKSVAWPSDPEVLAFIAELTRVEPEQRLLPTKDQMARKIWDIATDTERKVDPRDRLHGLRLFGEVMGYIEKPGAAAAAAAQVTINNSMSNKVMVIRDFGTDEEWEAKAKEQQRKLIAEARASAIDG